jgi:hypothetical protein
MEFKSIVVALLLLAVLFGWYAWLEAGERRRGRRGRERVPDKDEGDGGRADVDGELWKAE